MAQSKAILTALLGDTAAIKWWTSPNHAFNGLTPSQQWLIDYNVVYSYLLEHAFNGGYS